MLKTINVLFFMIEIVSSMIPIGKKNVKKTITYIRNEN